MAYLCNDCSYRSSKSGRGGECQACGSFNLSMDTVKPVTAPRGKARVVILVILWTYLITTILWKLNR